VDVSRSYAFYYNPNFKLIEDGWTLYQVKATYHRQKMAH
jgi:hypothetical protein